MITSINEFKQSLNENTDNIYLSFQVGPGGSAEDIMNDWNLKASEENGEMTISGSKQEVYAFADDYALTHLLDEDVSSEDNVSVDIERTTVMSIDDLFAWYSGSLNYASEPDSLELIQDNFFNEDMTNINIEELLQNKTSMVTIQSNDIGNVIDNDFELNGKTYNFDSISFPNEVP
jgi:hypothetical protein